MMQPQDQKACDHRSVIVQNGTGGVMRCAHCDSQLTWLDTMRVERCWPQEPGTPKTITENDRG